MDEVEPLDTEAEQRVASPRRAELSIFGIITAAVLLTTHSAVAILAVGDFARRTGKAHGIDRFRRANILDVTVCTFPFLLPYFIPAILAASTSAAGTNAGMPQISPLEVGLHNAHSWALLAVLLVALGTGWGKTKPAT